MSTKFICKNDACVKRGQITVDLQATGGGVKIDYEAMIKQYARCASCDSKLEKE